MSSTLPVRSAHSLLLFDFVLSSAKPEYCVDALIRSSRRSFILRHSAAIEWVISMLGDYLDWSFSFMIYAFFAISERERERDVFGWLVCCRATLPIPNDTRLTSFDPTIFPTKERTHRVTHIAQSIEHFYYSSCLLSLCAVGVCECERVFTCIFS